MPRGLFNWKFDDVVDFLKDHNFRFNYASASHYFYIGNQAGRLRNVCVPYHGAKAIKPRTMRGIILQSGLSKKVWLGKK